MIKDIFGITTYWVYGGGNGHYNIGSTDKFKLHRAFVSNSVVTKGNLDFRTEPTHQNFKYDTYLQQLKDAGIARIWCTQGTFDWFAQQGKSGKVMPVRDTDNPLVADSWKEAGELCRQIAIRYADDTAQFLSEAKVFQGEPAYLSNVPKAGLNLLDAIEIQNEWDFKHSWSGGTRTITPEEYAVCFKVCYDAIRSVSQSIKIIMGGGISPVMSTFTRFLAKLDELYAAEGKSTPNDFYLCFHWYMRNGSSDQGGGTSGITPEDAQAYQFGKSLDALCAERNLPGWYCTETGWATDTSKQQAPPLEGFTKEQAQGILMIRLALLWAACTHHKGISFWHCRDDYDLPPYAKGGINYKNWSAKPARTISEIFLATYGDADVLEYKAVNDIHYARLSSGKILQWTNNANIGNATPMPTETTSIPENPNPTTMLNVKNKRLYFGDNLHILAHADSPESRLKPGNEAAFKTECDRLAAIGINTITATMRGDDITQVFPWVNSSPLSSVDTAKLQKWRDQLKYFIDACKAKGINATCILYLGERTNFNSITIAQYQQWIDAMAPIFSDIAGHCIFGWEEIWNGSAAVTMQFADTVGSYLKSKLPGCLVMVHNNPGQKPWNAASNVVDVMCIQETSMSAMGASAIDAFNKNYAVHLHEPYNGFRASQTQAQNLASLDELYAQAQGITSGYGIFAADYDLQTPDAAKLEHVYVALVAKINGTTPPPPPPPNPTTMQIGYSTKSDRTDFKEFSAAPVPLLPVYIEARGVTPTVTFTLKKDGVVIKTQNENGAPFDCHGGQAFTPTAGQYELTVKDKNGQQTVTFTAGEQAPAPNPKGTGFELLQSGKVKFSFENGATVEL